jgi:hypothetical protein
MGQYGSIWKWEEYVLRDARGRLVVEHPGRRLVILSHPEFDVTDSEFVLENPAGEHHTDFHHWNIRSDALDKLIRKQKGVAGLLHNHKHSVKDAELSEPNGYHADCTPSFTMKICEQPIKGRQCSTNNQQCQWSSEECVFSHIWHLGVHYAIGGRR